jgi:hypothetical protein
MQLMSAKRINFPCQFNEHATRWSRAATRHAVINQRRMQYRTLPAQWRGSRADIAELRNCLILK